MECLREAYCFSTISPTNKENLIRTVREDWDNSPQQLMDHGILRVTCRVESCRVFHGMKMMVVGCMRCAFFALPILTEPTLCTYFHKIFRLNHVDHATNSIVPPDLQYYQILMFIEICSSLRFVHQWSWLLIYAFIVQVQWVGEKKCITLCFLSRFPHSFNECGIRFKKQSVIHFFLKNEKRLLFL